MLLLLFLLFLLLLLFLCLSLTASAADPYLSLSLPHGHSSLSNGPVFIERCDCTKPFSGVSFRELWEKGEQPSRPDAITAQKAGCLLSIAENTLDEVEHTSHFQFFKSNDRNTAIYFQEDLSELDTFVNKVEKLENPTTVYLFSWGNKSEFESMFDHIPNINIKTIPQPILEIYKKIYYINN